MTRDNHQHRRRREARRARSALRESAGWHDLEPDDLATATHEHVQRLHLLCPHCRRHLGTVAAEPTGLRLRPQLDRDAWQRLRPGQSLSLNVRGADLVAHLAYQNVSRGLVWQCTNRAAHGYEWGQVDMAPVLTLVEAVRLTPGPSGVGVEATGPAMAGAILDRVASRPGEASPDTLSEAVRDGWVRQWDGLPATWARRGFELTEPEGSQTLGWCDGYIGTSDVPPWHPDRGRAVLSPALRSLAEFLSRATDQQTRDWASQLVKDPAALHKWNAQQNRQRAERAEHWTEGI